MTETHSTTVQFELPVRLVAQAQKLVEAGWFRTFDELFQEALRRFLESHRAELMEEFIRQDVEWGLHGDESNPERDRH